MDVFVQLEGEAPLGVGFDIVDDQGGDGGGFAPFGLEEEEAAGVGEGGPFFGPVEVGFVEDDYFELVCERGDARGGGL